MFKSIIFSLLLTIPSPNPGYRVLDQANVLSPEAEAQLETLSREVDRATTSELAVVTVSSLEGMSVEEYANTLFNKWGIGKRGVNNGVLILVAPNERRARIEVGYGLEPILPDGLCGAILDEHAIPRFKDGDFQSGIVRSAERISNIVQGLPDQGRAELKAASQHASGTIFGTLITKTELWNMVIVGGFITIIIAVVGFMPLLLRRFPRPLYFIMMISMLAGIGAFFAAISVWQVAAGLAVIPALFLVAITRRFNCFWCPKCRRSGTFNEKKYQGKINVIRRCSYCGYESSRLRNRFRTSSGGTSSSDSGSSGSGSDSGGGSSGGGGASGSW